MAKRIPNKKLVDMYSKKGCNVSATCAALNISRWTFYIWRDKDEKLKKNA